MVLEVDRHVGGEDGQVDVRPAAGERGSADR
jgi:hypothetical protein